MLECILKLAASVVCGSALGFERQRHQRPAGLRTHILVCLGSTLIMMVSIYIFQLFKGETSVDPGRIASYVVSGIGFLGAGTIIQARGGIKGLTTAASLWIVAGVGLAVGCGLYYPAFITTFIAYGVLYLLDKMTKRLMKGIFRYNLELQLKDKKEIQAEIEKVLSEFTLSYFWRGFKTVEEKGEIRIVAEIGIEKPEYAPQIIKALSKIEGISLAEWSYS
jgi:putative Mg2+ transporter-C (MgtC) family protein